MMTMTVKVARRRKRASTRRHSLPPISVLGLICMLLLVVPTVKADISRIKYDKGSCKDGGVISPRAYDFDGGKDLQGSQSKRIAIIGKARVDTFIHHAGSIIIIPSRVSC